MPETLNSLVRRVRHAEKRALDAEVRLRENATAMEIAKDRARVAVFETQKVQTRLDATNKVVDHWHTRALMWRHMFITAMNLADATTADGRKVPTDIK